LLSQAFQCPYYLFQHEIGTVALDANAFQFDKKLDVWGLLYQFRQFTQRGDGNPREPFTKAIRFRGGKACELLCGIISNGAPGAAHAIQRPVMKQHKRAIRGQLHVHFHKVCTGFNGCFDTDHGIFRIVGGITPMSDQFNLHAVQNSRNAPQRHEDTKCPLPIFPVLFVPLWWNFFLCV